MELRQSPWKFIYTEIQSGTVSDHETCFLLITYMSCSKMLYNSRLTHSFWCGKQVVLPCTRGSLKGTDSFSANSWGRERPVGLQILLCKPTVVKLVLQVKLVWYQIVFSDWKKVWGCSMTLGIQKMSHFPILLNHVKYSFLRFLRGPNYWFFSASLFTLGHSSILKFVGYKSVRNIESSIIPQAKLRVLIAAICHV